jgi:hypothetical protein
MVHLLCEAIEVLSCVVLGFDDCALDVLACLSRQLDVVELFLRANLLSIGLLVLHYHRV